MQDEQNESKALVRQFSDKSRKIARVGKQFIVPHKFTPQGEAVNDANFDIKRDISRLTLDDFRLLAALQEKKWDNKAACESLGVDLEKAERRLKKLAYFEFEDKKAHSLAAVATPDFVTAKNIEGFYADNLSDGQRDHLKELAKITGAYKQQAPTTQINVFNLPALPPDQEAKLKEVFDTLATEVDSHAA